MTWPETIRNFVGIWKKPKARRAERTAIERNREESLRLGEEEQGQTARSPFDEGFLSGLKR
jgi:hypothetical protein